MGKLENNKITHPTLPPEGILYIVATPIGNREDITLRALQILKSVDLIMAEDTRHSQWLLDHYHIPTPLRSFHRFNEEKKIPFVLDQLRAGKKIALISDAGTPLISDPGYLLVRKAREAHLKVIPIPGPCAAITALCASGLPTHPFFFGGFLPQNTGEKKERLSLWKHMPYTLVFYESPHRIVDSIETIHAVLGNTRSMVLAKELTKLFEIFFIGTSETILAELTQNAHHTQGEFVILLEGAPSLKEEDTFSEETQRILSILSRYLSPRQAVAATAEITETPRNRLKKKLYKETDTP